MAEWQTREIQNLLSIRVWGFKSPPRHQLSLDTAVFELARIKQQISKIKPIRLSQNTANHSVFLYNTTTCTNNSFNNHTLLLSRHIHTIIVKICRNSPFFATKIFLQDEQCQLYKYLLIYNLISIYYKPSE